MLEFFDRVYVIHTPNPERRKAMEAQVDACYIGAKVPGQLAMSNMRRNPAREFGVNLSHIKAVVQAIADGVETALFLEDDVVVGDMQPALDELPLDWDIVYFGGHPREPVKPHSANLVRVGKFSFAESYALNWKSLREFHGFWCDRIGQKDAMYDFILGEYAASHLGYCAYPLVTRQVTGISQVSGKVDDKTDLLRKGWQTNLSP